MSEDPSEKLEAVYPILLELFAEAGVTRTEAAMLLVGAGFKLARKIDQRDITACAVENCYAIAAGVTSFERGKVGVN